MKPSNTYTTMYGFLWAHNGHKLEKNNKNLREAIFRTLNLRKPDQPGHEAQMRNAQMQFIRHNKNDIYRLFWKNPESTSYDFDFELKELVEQLLLIRHKKRLLRIHAYDDVRREGLEYLALWCRKAEGKMKPDEIAKANKYGRIIIDFGVAASLQGVMYSSIAKMFLSREIYHSESGSLFVFVPKNDDLDICRYMTMMFFSRHKLNFILIACGDDACLAKKNKNNVWMKANIDVNSCDQSQTPVHLEWTLELLQFPRDVARAMCLMKSAPITFYSTVDKGMRKDRVRATPLHMHMPSGSPDTTLVSTTGLLNFWYACVINDPQTPEQIVDCAADVGYDVDYVPVEKAEDYQFLKRSLTMDKNGEYWPTLNLGVIFRASGCVRGDLPGRGCIARRACEFQRALMTGLLAGINCDELSYLKPAAADIVIDESYLHHGSKSPSRDYDLHDILNRYDLTVCEEEEIRHMLLCNGFGKVVYSKAVEKVYKKDYGLELPSLKSIHLPQ